MLKFFAIPLVAILALFTTQVSAGGRVLDTFTDTSGTWLVNHYTDSGHSYIPMAGDLADAAIIGNKLVIQAPAHNPSVYTLAQQDNPFDTLDLERGRVVVNVKLDSGYFCTEHGHINLCLHRIGDEILVQLSGKEEFEFSFPSRSGQGNLIFTFITTKRGEIARVRWNKVRLFQVRAPAGDRSLIFVGSGDISIRRLLVTY